MIFFFRKKCFPLCSKVFYIVASHISSLTSGNYCLYAMNGGDQILPPIKHLTLVFGSPDFSYCFVFQMFQHFYVSLALSPVLSVTL